MIKALLFSCLAGLVAAQYGRGGSGYGPDGVRNRYFILGHGRGPISTSLGSGIYGTSLGSSSSYGPSSGSSYGHASGPSYGHASGSSYSAPAPARYSAPAPPSHSSGYSSGNAYGGSGYGSSHLGGYGGHQESSYAPAAPAYAPAPVHSYAPAPQSYAPAVASYSAPSRGYSAPARSYGGHHDDYAQPTPYDFGYDVHNEHGDQQSRQETGDGHGNVKGSYGYRDSYGIFRHVDYVADKDGFRANVRTNEPGTDNQDPADVKMQVEHGGHHGY